MKIPLLNLKWLAWLWIPMTLNESSDKIGEPEEPLSVIHKWYILSVKEVICP